MIFGGFDRSVYAGSHSNAIVFGTSIVFCLQVNDLIWKKPNADILVNRQNM